MYSALPVE